ncbi:MAG: porin [Betaproteobacteria bacterium]|nr:porin [Betaproteobacteria bacterium]
MLAAVAFLGANLSSSTFAIDLHIDPQIKNTKIIAANETSPVTDNTAIKLGKNGLQIETADGDFKFKLGGRVHADASTSSDDNFLDSDGNQVNANNGTELRRGRIEYIGTFFRDWIIKNQLEFAGDEISLRDLWLRYAGLDFVDITVGEQKQAFSRELQESSNDMLFIERSVMNVINGALVDRAMGVNISSQGDIWAGQVGIYGDSIATNKRKIAADEGWSVSSRFSFTPIAEKNKLIHLGIAGNYREPNGLANSTLQLASRSTNMSNLSLIQSTTTDINNIKMLGLEASAILGPFSLGGEYTNTWINRKKGESNLYFNGWYGEAAWTLTGEQRNYKNGRFFRVKPTNNFNLNKKRIGAWELAARYSEVDLNDGNFNGGKLSNLTIALNWYLNENIRLMAGYDKALDITDSPLTNSDGSKPDNLDTFMFRAQLVF